MARSDWWPYRHCYAAVKGAWNEIELILARRCPSVYSQLVSSKGATEEDIASCVKKLKVDLPNDYRCSLRIHDQLLSLGDLDYPACSRIRYVLLGLKDLFTVDFEIKLSVYRKQVMVRKESMLVLAKYALCNVEMSALEPFSELLVVLSSASEEDRVSNVGKTKIVVKPTYAKEPEMLFSGTGVTITTWGERHLGAAIRSSDFITNYVTNKVATWVEEITSLSEIAVSYPQAALSAYTHGFISS
jgi:hypothetical protein